MNLSGWIIAFVGVATFPMWSSSDELYIGLKHERLSAELGVQIRTAPTGSVHFEWPNDLGIRRIVLRVFPTETDAQTWFNLSWRRVSISPSAAPDGPSIGDQFSWWRNMVHPEKVSTVQVRRKNICFWFTSDSKSDLLVDDALALARRIDTLIRDNREIAPLGKFDVLPEIVSTGIPKTLTVQPMKEPLPPPAEGVRRVGNWPEFRNPGGGDTERAYVNIQPRFRGLGDVNKLRLRLVRTAQPGYGNMLESLMAPETCEYPPGTVPIYVPDGPDRVRVVKRSEAAAEGIDGRFIMRIVVPDEAKTLKLTMIAATEDNLIVTKDVEVRIVPQE